MIGRIFDQRRRWNSGIAYCAVLDVTVKRKKLLRITGRRKIINKNEKKTNKRDNQH